MKFSFFPAWTDQLFLSLHLWQWFELLLFFGIALIIERILTFLGAKMIEGQLKVFIGEDTHLIDKMLAPLTKLMTLGVFYLVLPNFHLNETAYKLIQNGVDTVGAVIFIWFGLRFVAVLAYYLNKRADLTETRFDDILVPLVTKSLNVFVVIIGLVFVAASFEVNVSGIIAGLGIGGLAFAFAAKDTLANFFGSIMLVLDRPFDIGDVVTAGDITGTIEAVGFRSTRIRTFNDSLITISNGDLANRAIDNKGKRRFRRMVTTLGLEYDTPADKIESFCEGVRQLILAHPWTRKDNFHVYFHDYNNSSLDVQVVVYWETDDYARELAERHRLLIDVLRFAKDLEVNFAFPTQTVHLFNEQSKELPKELKDYLDQGIARAKKVAQAPLSLKNPRSNSKDENQFGKNDIGF